MIRAFIRSLIVCMVGLWTVPLRAQSADLQGVYLLDVGASDSIDAAIERGIADMNFAIRPMAHSRMAKTNPRYERVTLSRESASASASASASGSVRVQFDARTPIEIPLDGRAVPWIREDGGKYDVSAQWSATQLVMHFMADDGERVNTFVLGPDGNTLKLNVRLASPRLPAPVTYVLAYRRQAS